MPTKRDMHSFYFGLLLQYTMESKLFLHFARHDMVFKSLLFGAEDLKVDDIQSNTTVTNLEVFEITGI